MNDQPATPSKQQECLLRLVAIADAARRLGSRWADLEAKQTDPRYIAIVERETSAIDGLLLSLSGGWMEEDRYASLRDQVVLEAILTGYQTPQRVDEQPWRLVAYERLRGILANRMPELFTEFQPQPTVMGGQVMGETLAQGGVGVRGAGN